MLFTYFPEGPGLNAPCVGLLLTTPCPLAKIVHWVPAPAGNPPVFGILIMSFFRWYHLLSISFVQGLFSALKFSGTLVDALSPLLLLPLKIC